MSLQAWLPLNGDLHSQGLLPITITEYGNMTISNSGKIGKCYTFDGSDDYLSLEGLNFSDLSEFSFSFWCKPLNNSLLGVFQIKSGGSVALQFATANSFTFRDSEHSALTGVKFNTPVAGEWAHYTFVYNKGSWLVYKNGIQDGSGFTAAQDATFQPSSTTVFIGCRRITSGSYYFSGDLNDFRIYNHALSKKEVEEIAKGLVLHYKLNNSGMGGDNLALNTRKLNIASNKTNLYMYRRGAPTIQLRNDGFSEVKCTASYQGLSFWANQLNLSVGTKVTYSFYVYGNGSSRKLSFYPMMYDSAGTRDTSTGLPISVDGGIYTTANAKAFTNTTATSPEYHYVTFEWNQAVANIITNGGSIELSIQVHGTWNSGDWACIFSPKVEIGDKPTAWSPAKSELGNMATIVYDSSGYSNNGTVIGNLSSITPSPRYDAATVFDGSSSAIKVNNNNWCSQGMEQMTINVWVKASSWPANTRLFSCTESGGFNLEGGHSGYYRFSVNVYTNADKTSSAYKNTGEEIKISDLSTTDWNMLTFVYDLTGTKTYINGELHYVYSNISYGIHFNMSARLFLGCEANLASPISPYFNGQESDFRIYATALSAQQIKELYITSMQIDSSGNVFARELVEL